MIFILCVFIFGIIAVLTLLVTIGLPLGEFTLGGKFKVLPSKMRVVIVKFQLIFFKSNIFIT